MGREPLGLGTRVSEGAVTPRSNHRTHLVAPGRDDHRTVCGKVLWPHDRWRMRRDRSHVSCKTCRMKSRHTKPKGAAE